MKIINDHINEKRFKQVYLLYGEEQYLKRQYAKRLRVALVGEDDMNYTRFNVEKPNCKEIIDTCDTLPFFADRRVVIIEGSGYFKNACPDELSDYIKKMPDYLNIIFVEKEIDKRNKLYKAVSNVGYISEMVIPDEKSLQRWIAQMAKEDGKSFNGNALTAFVTRTCESMDNMKSEYDKLISYIGDRNGINIEDVDEICIERVENRIFDMITAVGMKNQKQAMKLYYDLRTLREAPLKILILMERQFSTLYETRLLMDEGLDANTIAKKLNTKTYFVSKNIDQAKRYTALELKNAVTDCVDMDEAVKTGAINDVLSVELIIVKYSSREE